MEKLEPQQQPSVIDYVPSVAISLEQAAANLQKLDGIRKRIMREGVDFAQIPGTPRPSLLKPGAERFLQFYGLGHRVHCVEKMEDWENGFFYYRYHVTIIKTYPNYEITVAECEGSANSKEARYRDRWVTESKLRDAGVSSTAGLELRQREGRYGTYTEYKIENPDPFSLVNTLQKMAIKRALVGATLQATGTSGFFTQDIEDLPEESYQQEQPVKASGNRQGHMNGNGKPKSHYRDPAAPASEAQQRAIYTIGKSKGLDENQVKHFMANNTSEGKMSARELTMQEAGELINLLQDNSKELLLGMITSTVKADQSDGTVDELKELGLE